MPSAVARITREHVEAFIEASWLGGADHGVGAVPGPPAALPLAGGGGGDYRVADGLEVSVRATPRTCGQNGEGYREDLDITQSPIPGFQQIRRRFGLLRMLKYVSTIELTLVKQVC
jgi:hypothetical protein